MTIGERVVGTLARVVRDTPIGAAWRRHADKVYDDQPPRSSPIPSLLTPGQQDRNTAARNALSQVPQKKKGEW